jgi:hypothetical protein
MRHYPHDGPDVVRVLHAIQKYKRLGEKLQSLAQSLLVTMDRSPGEYSHPLMMNGAGDLFQIGGTYNVVSLLLLGTPAQKLPKVPKLLLGAINPNDIILPQPHEGFTDMKATVQELRSFLGDLDGIFAGDDRRGTRLETHDNSFANRGPKF